MKPRLKQLYVPGSGVFEGQTVELNAAGDTLVFGRRVHADASASPTTSNDDTEGYAPGSLWVRLDTDEAWICVDDATGNAKWAELGLGGTEYQEPITTENISGADTALADQLDKTPVNDGSVKLFLNGVFQKQGATNDYSISGKVITWLPSSGTGTGTAVDMDTTDVLEAAYESLE